MLTTLPRARILKITSHPPRPDAQTLRAPLYNPSPALFWAAACPRGFPHPPSPLEKRERREKKGGRKAGAEEESVAAGVAGTPPPTSWRSHIYIAVTYVLCTASTSPSVASPLRQASCPQAPRQGFPKLKPPRNSR
uniref:Uncharacterized protein n=1 Tax=Setaria viridis TaxID=4556 RepID=A0A4U6TFB9_SETVI|nr:hypothetical protein SEVIR_8G048600v2 [Setaria viridis]